MGSSAGELLGGKFQPEVGRCEWWGTVCAAFLDDVIRDYKEHGRLDTQKCAMAKMWLPEMEARIMDTCVQLHGGAGYMDEYPISRLYTAARLHRIFAGTAEIMRLLVARSI